MFMDETDFDIIGKCDDKSKVCNARAYINQDIVKFSFAIDHNGNISLPAKYEGKRKYMKEFSQGGSIFEKIKNAVKSAFIENEGD